MTRSLCLAAAAVLALTAACGGPTATGSSPSPRADATHAYLSYAICLRAHGANEPDPALDQNGNPQWAVNPKTLPPAATQPCNSILQAAHLNGGHGAPTAAQLAQLTRFAQCIRQHGVADFPDPDAQTGSFPTTQDPTREPGWDAAYQACKQLMPTEKVG
jgi:hypothetical protein